ncbi:arginine decarboxylase [Candidatus Thiomargarita nelsonii]|uniref:Biosynthetic arginine decarboxylase n=1 Tax=Candidatus Thiomargarita nelsonii TaxID=1003181 RepID=A0A0A6PA75_9GAMM|nr:arginine decarboxylase [Candidatus Thiomargarita nelsonii]
MSTQWDIAQSRTLYNIEHWSDGYFDINPNGEVIVSPIPGQAATVNLHELAQSFAAHGLSLPVLVRFPNILHHRVEHISNAFATAMQQQDYHANYTPVYPIKVNQQHQVVKEIMSVGRVGLEVGSKSEMMAVLALAPADGGIIICNGYKDREYIRLALIGQQIGLCPYLVIEKISELNLIIEESRSLNVTPCLGMRVRLAAIGKGKWQNTGGEKGKFGLSAAQVLEIITLLKEADLLDSLQLMHFHIGSQISNIGDIQGALREAARYYAELRALCVPIQNIDVGGGLGIDYEGTGSRSACSANYSVQEYANNVVHEFGEICNTLDLPQPNIITESGRAMTAHHAVLITNLIDIESAPGIVQPEPASADEPAIIQDLWHGLTHLTQRSALEAYHDAVYWLSEAHTMFTHGLLNVTQRARAEQLYYSTCQQVRSLLQQTHPHSRACREVVDELNEKLVDKYFCNFSLFQSVPDAWAIDQLFPILPLHRLNECPDRRATLQDLTCDSDGQFQYYVNSDGVDTSLPVHLPTPDAPYLLGIFLVGAYQEILGDMHNLFGDTYSVNVHIKPDGDYELVAPLEGDTVETMLNYVNFETGFLRNTYRKRLQAAPLTVEQRQLYLRELEAGLIGYTYLER